MAPPSAPLVTVDIAAGVATLTLSSPPVNALQPTCAFYVHACRADSERCPPLPPRRPLLKCPPACGALLQCWKACLCSFARRKATRM